MIRFLKSNLPSRLVYIYVCYTFIFIVFQYFTNRYSINEVRFLTVGNKITFLNPTHYDVLESISPFSAYFLGFVFALFGKNILAFRIIGFLVFLLIGGYLNFVFNKYSIIKEKTYFPIVSFSLLIIYLFSYDILSPQLLSLFFIIIAFETMLGLSEKEHNLNSEIFNIGILISVSVLFYLPNFVFILLGFMAILFFTSPNLYKITNYIAGLSLPILAISPIYILNKDYELFSHIFNLSFFDKSVVSLNFKDLLNSTLMLFLLSVISVVTYFTGEGKNFDTKVKQLLIFWILLGGSAVYFDKNFTFSSLIVFAVPLAYSISKFMLSIKNTRYAELFILALLISVLSGSFMFSTSMNGGSIVLNKLNNTYENKTILILDDDYSYYFYSKPATKFVNWNLSKNQFLNINDDKNLKIVFQELEKNRPEIIIDPNKVFSRIIDRVPFYSDVYKEKNGVYFLVKN